MNWEALFVQPLLADLGAGKIGDAKDWADAITRYYMNTIKTGRPVGVVASLPAPGLNIIAPPPFTIGPSPIQPSLQRTKAFNAIVYAYFASKDLAINKTAIKQLAVDIKDVINQIKQAQQEVRTTIDQIKIVTQELKDLPKTIEEMKREIQDEIEYQKTELTNLFQSFDLQGDLAKTFGAENIKQIFAKEIQAVNVIKNFKVTDLSSFDSLIKVYDDFQKLMQSATNLGQAASSDRLEILKTYIQKRLFEVVKRFADLITNINDPKFLLKFFTGLAARRPKLGKLITILKRFSYLLEYVKPQLKRLEKKKKALIEKIKVWLQARLLQLQEAYKTKIEEFKKKFKNSKLVKLYKNAEKRINDFKKKNSEKIRRQKKNIEISGKIFNTAKEVYKKIRLLEQSAKEEFKTLQREIEEYEKALQKKASGFSQDLQDKLNTGLVAATVQKDTLQQSLKETSATNLVAKLKELENYLGGLGGLDPIYSALVFGIVEQTKCEISTFQKFFEKKRNTLKKYAAVIAGISADIDNLKKLYKELKDNNPRDKKLENTLQQKEEEINRVQQQQTTRSLKELLTDTFKHLKDKLKAITKRVKDWVAEYKAKATEEVKKYQEDLEIMLLNLIPANVEVQDAENKKLIAEAKKRKVQFRLRQAKELYDLVKQSMLMIEGGAIVVQNFASGRYFFTDNEAGFNKFIDGYYGLQLERNETRMFNDPASGKPGMDGLLAEKLEVERRKVKADFQGLLAVEVIVKSIYQIIKDVKQTDFLKELKEFAQSANAELKEKISPFLSLFEGETIKSLPLLLNKVEAATRAIVTDVQIANKLYALERKYLGTTRKVIKNLIYLNNTTNNTKGFKTVADKIQGEKYKATLKKIDAALNKEASFVKAGFESLGEVVTLVFNWIQKLIKKAFDYMKRKLQERRQRREEEKRKELEDETRRRVNVDAKVMSVVFGLAARVFWTGNSWTGSTGTRQVALSIGRFKPIKGLIADGGSGLVREMAVGFEGQLNHMRGLIIPPPATGIIPFPFNVGYK